VFLRKHALWQAAQLDVVGWIANTARKTVLGEIQGGQAAVEQMKARTQTPSRQGLASSGGILA
jgi:hypothetical protein